jgi:hypothetical protein
MKKRFAKIPAFISLLAVLIALPFTVFLAKRQQTYLGEATTQEDSPYGININKIMELSVDQRKEIYQKLKDAGVVWLRDAGAPGNQDLTSWARIEPEPGQWNFAEFDAEINLITSYGFYFLGFLGNPPDWALLEGTNGDHPVYRYQFKDYAKKMVERYGCNGGTCQIKYWEVGNEPNNNDYYKSNVAQYGMLLKGAYEGIKEKDPQAIVLLGGFGNGLNDASNPFHKPLFWKNYKNYFDIFNFHVYGKYQETINIVMNLAETYGFNNKPIWMTETGTNSDSNNDFQNDPTGEKNQANALIDRYNKALSQGIKKVFWFRYLDSGASNWWGTIGIFHQDLSPKLAYYVYQKMAVQPSISPSSSLTPSSPPAGGGTISGNLWFDTNANGRQSVDNELSYSCSGSQTKPRLELFKIGDYSNPVSTIELNGPQYEFTGLEPNKYRIKFAQLPVCNGVQYQITKWRMRTAISLGTKSYVANYAGSIPGTTGSSNWTSTPYWAIQVFQNETTNVFLGIK